MAVSLKHIFQSTLPDDPDATLVRPSNWNDEHNLVMSADRILGRTTAGNGAVEEITIGAGLTLAAGSLSNSASTSAIGYAIDGGGAVIATGTLYPALSIPFACTINSVTVLADQTGDIVVDIWKDSFANYPPTVADSICASAKPTLSSAIKSEDTTLAGWTTAIAAGDVLLFNVDSAATVESVSVILKVTKA